MVEGGLPIMAICHVFFGSRRSLVPCTFLHEEFRMQLHTEFRGIPGIFTAKNTAEFRGIPYVFHTFRIPSEVKNALPWTPYLYQSILIKVLICKCRNRQSATS